VDDVLCLHTDFDASGRASSDKSLLGVSLHVAAVTGHVRLDVCGTVTADRTHVARRICGIDGMEKTGRRYSKSNACEESEEKGEECGLHFEYGADP